MKKKLLIAGLSVFSAVMLCVGIILIIRENVLLPGAYVPPELSASPVVTAVPTAAPSATPVAAPSTSPSATPEPIPTPSPTPHEYVKVAPTRIYFTKREIMCDIVPVGIVEEGDKKGQMETVDSHELAAWLSLGPAPGEPGNAIVNGHVRFHKIKGYFSILPELEIGEEVVFAMDDNTYRTFHVASVDFYPYNDVPPEVMSVLGETRVTLITCHGEFQTDVGTSEQRCVVVLKP